MKHPCVACNRPTGNLMSVDMDLPPVPVCGAICWHRWLTQELENRRER